MKRKGKILLVLSFLFILILFVSYSYSKYRSDVTGTAATEVAKWNISVNGCNIVNPNLNTNPECFESVDNGDGTVTVVKNFSITDFSYDNNGNSNVVEGKIAPGSSGQFRLIIQPNDTEVSIKYTINSHIEDSDSALSYYIKGPNDTTRIAMPATGYVGYITYDESNASLEDVIVFYVDWENNEANNEEDTVIGTKSTNPTLDIPVEITFEQYNG